MARISPNAPCPCGRERKFKKCCGRLHKGAPAQTPEDLMRSRYAAYAVGAVRYLIATTHPSSPHAEGDARAWRKSLQRYCHKTNFLGLEIQATEDAPDGQRGWVTFHARLARGGEDASFTERSLFVRHESRWTYHSGELLEQGP